MNTVPQVEWWKRNPMPNILKGNNFRRDQRRKSFTNYNTAPSNCSTCQYGRYDIEGFDLKGPSSEHGSDWVCWFMQDPQAMGDPVENCEEYSVDRRIATQDRRGRRKGQQRKGLETKGPLYGIPVFTLYGRIRDDDRKKDRRKEVTNL